VAKQLKNVKAANLPYLGNSSIKCGRCNELMVLLVCLLLFYDFFSHH